MTEDVLLTVLKMARSYIDKPSKLAKHSFARDKEGIAVLVNSDDAVCFCAEGAVQRAVLRFEREDGSGRLGFQARYLEAENAFRVLGESAQTLELPGTDDAEGGVSEINDNHETEHHHIMAMFDHAIAAIEAHHT